MNALGLILALLLGGAQSADPAADGTRTGSRLDPATRAITNADTSQANATMYRFMECAVARRESRVRVLIDSRSEAEFQSAYRALDDVQRCNVDAYVDNTASTIAFTADRGTTRGFLSEIFLKKKTDAFVALTPLPIQQVYARDWYSMTGRARAVDEMATCVADVDPAAIAALLHTGIGGSDQKTAIAALMPSVGQCLSKTVRLKTNPLGLRTALAEALYHRVNDAAPQPTPGAK
jgi:hypothetical protein